MDIHVSRTLYMSCQAGPGIEPGPSALKASALPIKLTWQTKQVLTIQFDKLEACHEKHIKKYNCCLRCNLPSSGHK